MNRTVYNKSNSHRKPEYRVGTRIISLSEALEDNMAGGPSQSLVVEKYAEIPAANSHIKRIRDNYYKIKELYKSIKPVSFLDALSESKYNSSKKDEKDNVFSYSYAEAGIERIRFPYIAGTSLLDNIDFSSDTIEEIVAKAEAIFKTIFDFNDECVSDFKVTEDFKSFFPECEALLKNISSEKLKSVCPANIDGCARNFIQREEELFVYDYEWVLDFPVPIDYIKFRCLLNDFYLEQKALSRRISKEKWFSLFFTEKQWKLYEQMDECLIFNIHGENREWIYSWRYLKPTYSLDDMQQGGDADDYSCRCTGGLSLSSKGNENDLKKIKLGPVYQVKKLLRKIKSKNRCNGSLAVHLHLYYEDLASELFAYVNNIPYPYDLYISVSEDVNINRISAMAYSLKYVNRVAIKPVINRGRDIAPMLVDFGKEIAAHDYFLHIHSKKSLYSGSEQIGWRYHVLQSLLGSYDTVCRIFDAFKDDSVGMVYPMYTKDTPPEAYHWLKNEDAGRKLLTDMGFEFEGGIVMYPVGSFYFARTAALKPIFDRNFKIEDFEEEKGASDGTLAHVLERAIAVINRQRGYKAYLFDREKNEMVLESPGIITKQITGSKKNEIRKAIKKADTVSFDLFDTLIARAVCSPKEVYPVLFKRATEEGFVFENWESFYEKRQEAEGLAVKEKGAYTTLSDIYEHFSTLNEEQKKRLCTLEMEVEYILSLPRLEVIELFNEAINLGKDVIIVSDMYLPLSFIKMLLKKHDIKGYKEIFLSCDRGLRKDDDSIWDLVFKKYPKSGFCHIGDNFRSDWQTLIDRKAKAFIVANPEDMAVLLERGESSLNEEKRLGLGIISACNNPFFNGIKPVISDIRFLGLGVVGPLIYSFLDWLNTSIKPGDIPVFITREGYVLKPLYEGYLGEKRGIILKASRRACGVASIINTSDMKELLEEPFSGKIRELFKYRFGIELDTEEAQKEVTVGSVYEHDDTEFVCKLLLKYEDEILSQAAKERESYISYIKKYVDEEDFRKMVIIDVGYSGSIQYYLSKMLEVNVEGRYLATRTKGHFRPNRLGMEPVSLYSEDEPIGEFIFKNSLFLEVATTVEEGQLLYFTAEEDGAVHKPSNPVSKDILALQESIHDSIKMMKYIYGNRTLSKITGENFVNILKSVTFSEKVQEALCVEDDYTKGTKIFYDTNVNEWKVKDNVKVSVVIPTYNGESELKALLSKLVNQRNVDIPEIIIVDSESTDGTVSVAKEYGAKVIEIKKASFTHSYARNLGASYATGEYILFMTEDAYPTDDLWVYKILSALKKNDAVACSPLEDNMGQGSLFYRISTLQYNRLLGDYEDKLCSIQGVTDSNELRKNAQLIDIACLIRRDIFEQYKYFGDYGEDLELGLRLIRDGHKILRLSETRVHHFHDRPIGYNLKRAYNDLKTLYKILPGCTVKDYKEEELKSEIFEIIAFSLSFEGCEYKSICSEIDKVMEEFKINEDNIKSILKNSRDEEEYYFNDLSMEFDEQNNSSYNHVEISNSNMNDYLKNELLPYLKEEMGIESLSECDDNLRREVINAVYSRAALMIGMRLADYFYYHNEPDWLMELTRGV